MAMKLTMGNQKDSIPEGGLASIRRDYLVGIRVNHKLINR
jgi:hypothetical protein